MPIKNSILWDILVRFFLISYPIIFLASKKNFKKIKCEQGKQYLLK